MDVVGKFENTDSIPVQKLVVLSEHNSMIKSSSIANKENGASIYGITHDGLYAIKDSEVYNLSANYTTGEISFNKLMDSPYEFKNASRPSPIFTIKPVRSLDKLIFLLMRPKYTLPSMALFSL